MGHFKMKLFSAATAVIIVCIQYCNGKHLLVQTKDTDYDEDPSAADYSYARPSTSAPSSYAARTSLIPKSKYGDYSYARPSTSAPSSYARPSTTAPRSKSGDYSYARPSTTAPRSKYGDYSYARPSTSAPSSYVRPSTVAPRSKYGSDYDYSSYSRPSYSRSGDSSRRSYGGSARSS